MTLNEWKEVKHLIESNDIDSHLDGHQLEDAFYIGYEFAMADMMFGDKE